LLWLDLVLFIGQTMEFEVKKLFETVNGIHDEMFYLRDR